MTECLTAETCPGVYETESGDFLVVGRYLSVDAVEFVPLKGTERPTVDKDEAAVLVPRDVMLEWRHEG